MAKKLRGLIIGAGDRGRGFARRVKEADVDISVKGVADPLKERRTQLAEDYNIPRSNIYSTGEKAIESGKNFDLVYIATPDKKHHKLAVMALEKGYNVLLEKPMATNPEDCIEIINARKKSEKFLAVCHVLRYAPFFQKINEIIASKELGKIRSIDLRENIAYWHYVHSYVRGNWRNESQSSPIILAKSCHDLDILSWLSDSVPCKIFSRGSLDFFRRERAPENSADRCTDGCPFAEEQGCPYDARQFYLGFEEDNDSEDSQNKEDEWPYNTISDDNSEEGRLEALKEGRYGKCVFKSDNDVCDNQEVSIEFENGIKATFLLRSGGTEPTREIYVYFEWGEIYGDLSKGVFKKIKYSGRWNKDEIEKIEFGEKGGHGGGDEILLNNVANMLTSHNQEKNLTSAERSLDSHLLAFAAEKSRKSGKLIEFNEYKQELGL